MWKGMGSMEGKKIEQAMLAQFFESTVKEERRQNQLLAPLRINYDTYRCLCYLYERPGGAEPSRLADGLLILRQTVTSIVDSLQKRGYAERVPHPTDRRRILVRLTADGSAVTEQALEISGEYHSRICACFTEEELKTYINMQDRVVRVRDRILAQMIEERSKR